MTDNTIPSQTVRRTALRIALNDMLRYLFKSTKRCIHQTCLKKLRITAMIKCQLYVSDWSVETHAHPKIPKPLERWKLSGATWYCTKNTIIVLQAFNSRMILSLWHNAQNALPQTSKSLDCEQNARTTKETNIHHHVHWRHHAANHESSGALQDKCSQCQTSQMLSGLASIKLAWNRNVRRTVLIKDIHKSN